MSRAPHWSSAEYNERFVPSPAPSSPIKGRRKKSVFITSITTTIRQRKRSASHPISTGDAPVASATATEASASSMKTEAAPPPPIPSPPPSPQAAPVSAAPPSSPPHRCPSVVDTVKGDVHAQHILSSLAGLPGFGMLEGPVMDRLKVVWSRLDFVKDDVLLPNDFESACGIDPLWHTLLNMCDLDSDGRITSLEFIMGFLALALSKPFQLQGDAMTTGMDVLKEMQKIVNLLVTEQIDLLEQEMRAQGAPGW